MSPENRDVPVLPSETIRRRVLLGIRIRGRRWQDSSTHGDADSIVADLSGHEGCVEKLQNVVKTLHPTGDFFSGQLSVAGGLVDKKLPVPLEKSSRLGSVEEDNLIGVWEVIRRPCPEFHRFRQTGGGRT